jgi:hypothetical protein
MAGRRLAAASAPAMGPVVSDPPFDEAQTPSRLLIEEDHPGRVDVLLQPQWRPDFAEAVDIKVSDEPPKARLLSVDATKSLLSIYPVGTFLSSRFLKPKYPQIREIALEGVDVRLPANEAEVRGLLREQLPSGFIRDPDFGLGIEKEFGSIITSIEKLDGVTSLVLTNQRETGRDKSIFFLTFDDFEDIRLAMARITRRYQAEGRADRAILAHNEILTKLDPAKFPEASRPYKPDTVFKLLSGGRRAPRLSAADHNQIIKTLDNSSSEALARMPAQLFALGETVERVSLEVLINRFEGLLAKGGTERAWQKLLDLNPFILSLVFGYPIVKLASQGHVGGWKLAGDGGKIADYVVKNQQTHSIALIELKTPGTELVIGEYRKGVPTISSKLTGAIVQVLDQRFQFQRSLPLLKETERELLGAQSYAVDCIVIAGRTPTNEASAKSLELFRGGLRDVRIFTFDELLGKMKALLNFLRRPPEAQPEPADADLPF